MRTITTTILILICIGNTLGQNNEKLAKKITKKMCDCIGFIDKYENLNAKLDSCYDLALNDIIMNATPKEIQIIGNTEEFNEVKNRIGKLIKVDCDAVKNVIIQEVQSSINESSYPTNFTTKELKEAKRNLDSYDGKIIAFDGKIVEVKSLGENKPYLKVELENGETVWIGSMVNSQFDKVGNSIRFLGYFY